MLRHHFLKTEMSIIYQRSITMPLRPLTRVMHPMVFNRPATTKTSISSIKPKATDNPRRFGRRRFIEVDSPFAKANKQIYLLPNDPYIASKKLSQILELGTINDAADYVKALPLHLQNVVIWNQLLNYCAKKGRINATEKYFAEMRKRGISPNEYTFTYMFTALEKSASPSAAERAESWFEKMKKYNVEPSIFHINILMRVYDHVGRPETAMEIMKRIISSDDLNDINPDSTTFSIALHICSDLENIDKASNELQNIWQAIKKRSSLSQLQQHEKKEVQSLLAEKASEIIWKEGVFRHTQKPLKLDDELVIALLSAVKRTATEQKKDISIGIEAIHRMYSLYPRSAAQIMDSYGLESEQRFHGFGYQPSIKVLDAIIRFAGRLKEFKLGSEYFQLALHQYPQLKPDEYVREAALWCDKQMKRKKNYENKKMNRINFRAKPN
ncbi:MAG: hypothetical protein EXX96DRAFT_558698 [Benjaminiella poitrasii]|nr:MAG: hypothetical protein EXX96DRAFT_558698 [Benjaminiella poitrasii]